MRQTNPTCKISNGEMNRTEITLFECYEDFMSFYETYKTTDSRMWN